MTSDQGAASRLRVAVAALQRIVKDRELHPDTGLPLAKCDECANPLTVHEPWCAAAVAKKALEALGV